MDTGFAIDGLVGVGCICDPGRDPEGAVVMRWTVHGERAIYQSPWIDLCLIDVEQPDGRRWEHHVVRLRDLAAVAVVSGQQRILMQWRHRFITDSWAWELPMGLIEEHETPEEAGAREVEEETGWRPGALTRLARAEIANGITDSEHHLFRADGATYVGLPTELTSQTGSSGSPCLM